LGICEASSEKPEGLHQTGSTSVIVQRWQGFTARHALHQASGQSFDERAETQHHD
jgi:hypothetical protein